MILVSSFFNCLQLGLYSRERLRKRGPDSLDVVTLLNIAASFFLIFRNLDYRGYNGVISYKIEVVFSGLVNICFYSMPMVLVQAWSGVLEKSAYSAGEQRILKKRRTIIFWVCEVMFFIGNVFFNFLDFFQLVYIKPVPHHLKGMEQIVKESTIVIFQTSLNMIMLLAYVNWATLRINRIIRSLVRDAKEVSESTLVTTKKLKRYLRAVQIGTGIAVLFYSTSIIPMATEAWWVRYPPCSSAEYYWGNLGGFIFYFLNIYVALFVFTNRTKKVRKERKIYLESLRKSQEAAKSTDLSAGSSGQSRNSTKNSSGMSGSSRMSGSSGMGMSDMSGMSDVSITSSFASSSSIASSAFESDVEMPNSVVE